ncbi:Protein of unknown function [Bacillus cytotoxicus]|uniref:Uncharacterized protein n=1 Tax=Bacillus cytotoxicus TaxID=580165 RepID=A0AAX2CKE8_9BACI|nr:Protein of unknown function [Bacillus cytotoxicus]SCN41355.1 Protein of unknown function [Bacillus cytotoxicus]
MDPIQSPSRDSVTDKGGKSIP